MITSDLKLCNISKEDALNMRLEGDDSSSQPHGTWGFDDDEDDNDAV